MSDGCFVFIVGSPRSGTTVLGTIFDRHRNIAQWYEPYFIWDRHFRDAQDDERSEKDAVPEIKAYLRKAFYKYKAKQGTRLIVDKSPRNSLKIPFIRKVFPEAKFVHILRDGRDTTLSINKEWMRRRNIAGSGNINDTLDYKSAVDVIQKWLRRQPYMLDRVRAFWFETHGNFINKKKHLNRLRWNGEVGWGPRFKNWRKVYNNASILQFNAHQWLNCVSRINESWEAIPEQNRIEIRYEDLVSKPDQTLEALLAFMGVDFDPDFLTAIPKLKHNNFNKWKTEFTDAQLSEITPILFPMLSKLGYQN